MSEDLRYPIGDFDRDFGSSPEARRERIQTIADLPLKILTAVAWLDEARLDTEYRPGGWTIRQTVHHIADSHTTSLTRFKLALTEDETPTVKPYYEDRWAELGDSKMPIDASMKIIEGSSDQIFGPGPDEACRRVDQVKGAPWWVQNRIRCVRKTVTGGETPQPAGRLN